MKRFIKIKTVTSLTGISKSYVYEMARRGVFPKPVRLSEHSVAWVESEVEEWMDYRIFERDNRGLKDDSHMEKKFV